MQHHSNTSVLAKLSKKWPVLQDSAAFHELLGSSIDAEQAWSYLRREVLRPEQPFELHQQLFEAVYYSWHPDINGPPPVWSPQQQDILQTNVARFMSVFQGDLQWEALRSGNPVRDWQLLLRVSCQNPEVFWAAVLKELGVQLAAPPTRILLENEISRPDTARWLPGARLNIAACALFSSRAPAPAAPAITWADEASPTILQHVTWAELQRRAMEVAACVAVRFQPGDALAIAMPLTVEAAIIYLGIVLAGCVVVSIADSFAAAEVATRLKIAQAKAIFTQDVVMRGGKAHPLYSRVVTGADVPMAIVISAGASATTTTSSSRSRSGRASPAPGAVEMRGGDISWEEFLQSPAGHDGGSGGLRPLPYVVDGSAYSNILFSSGTTGAPKAVPWSHITPLRCAVDGWALQDIHPGDVVAWPTNLGWMMGPWLLYATWINGGTVALYQGSPLGRDFGEFVSAAGVAVLGLVPSIVKAWRSSGCMAHLDWSRLRCFSSTGEASSKEDYHWLASRVLGYRPVIEYCGGTEIGGGFLAGNCLQPQSPSTFSSPTLGASLVLLLQDGQQSPHDSTAQPVTGELTLMPPMLGMSQALLNRDHHSTYYGDMPCLAGSGRLLRRHGDEVQRLPGGYYRALGRCDDTMNLGGIKVSSVELERVVLQHVAPRLAEVAAVGVPAPGGGPDQLYLFVVASEPGKEAGPEDVAKLQALCQAALKQHLNPLFKVDRLLLVPSLPRTASNKVVRRQLRDAIMAQRPRL